VIAQTLPVRGAVPERALQIAAAVGRKCSGWASGVLADVDRWLSGSASHSSAQAVIATVGPLWEISAPQMIFPIPPNFVANPRAPLTTSHIPAHIMIHPP